MGSQEGAGERGVAVLSCKDQCAHSPTGDAEFDRIVVYTATAAAAAALPPTDAAAAGGMAMRWWLTR